MGKLTAVGVAIPLQLLLLIKKFKFLLKSYQEQLH